MRSDRQSGRRLAARLLLMVGSALLLCAQPSLAQRLRRDATLAPEVATLSEQLAGFQKVLDQQFGMHDLIIGGGSSRAVLDSVYFGKTLKTRDVDLFVVPGRKVTPRFAATVAERLQAAYPGKLALTDLETRPRGNPELPLAQSARYVAGRGFFLKAPNGDVFDFSLYHTPKDLGLNGCLDVDTIMIPLRSGETLLEHVDKMRGKSYGRAVKEGLVVDDHGGYRSWQHNRLKVAHPAELASKPALWSIRLARAYGKAGYPALPPEVAGSLRKADRALHRGAPAKLVARYMERLLGDERAATELQMVKQAGVVAAHPGAVRLLGTPGKWDPVTMRARLGAPHKKAEQQR